MPNKAAQIRADIQSKWPGATVHARGKGWLKHAHPTEPNRYCLDTSTGAKYHHSGLNDEAHEIDTDWVDADPIADAPWLKKMIRADYHAYFGPGTQDFNAGQIVKYVHADTGEAITLEVQQLQWTNDLDQISPIADPQQVNPSSISENTITWASAFASGLDFRWITQSTRLIKFLDIQSPADLGSPPQYILDGGNPRLRISLIFQISKDVEVWVNGSKWNKRTEIATSDNIEFRLKSSQETLWWFRKPAGFSSSIKDGFPAMSMVVRKTGPNLVVQIVTPWAWLETATYPVHLDSTLDEDVSAGADDAFEETNNQVDLTLTAYNLWQDKEIGGWRYLTIPLDGTETINADTTIAPFIVSYTDMDCTLYGDPAADAAAFAATSKNLEKRGSTTATVSWVETLSMYTRQSSPSIATIIQEIIDNGSWAEDNALVILMAYLGSPDVEWFTYESAPDEAADLHIDYTAGGATPIEKSASDDLDNWRDERLPQRLGKYGVYLDIRGHVTN